MNAILRRHGPPGRAVVDLRDLQPKDFYTIIESVWNLEAMSPEEPEASRCQRAIDFLADDVLGMDLSHIDARAIAAGFVYLREHSA